jgi:hypothetical protein
VFRSVLPLRVLRALRGSVRFSSISEQPWARKDGSIFFPNEQFSPDELALDVWHHVAVTRQSDGTVEMYQDGVLASRRASRDSNGSFTLKFGTLGWERYPHHRAGGRDELANKFLAGAIDEFAAFDRALTDREIARLAGR